MSIKLTQFSHGGGCGCKIAPAILTELLAGTPLRTMPKELIVGAESSDDAAVYQLNDEQALVATTDFFTPIVDDPYDFGRIAATNAISDVYAMGGTPIMALALVGVGWWLAGGVSMAVAVALVWLAHIGMDRMVGYGLKYPDSAKRNHLGEV